MKKINIIVTSSIIILSFIIATFSSFNSFTLYKSHYIEFYDKNDNLIYSELYEKEGKYLYLEEINNYTQKAFIAIEDKNFYSHHGFDILRNIKAFFKNLFSLSIKEGASTITQQYARNTLLNNKRTFSRKLKEAYYTLKIEHNYSKNEILEGYLNSIYLGHGLTGIDEASHYYFNKEAISLTLGESASIAGITHSPANYTEKETIIKRRNYVLYQMLLQNYITQAEYNLALKEELQFSNTYQKETNLNYYKDIVINELKENNIDISKGIKVYTNLDYNLYTSIDEIINKYIPLNKDIQTSIVIMEPFTNKVIYLLGGFNYNLSSYNRAIYSTRQIGSTIKPLIYLLALANGFSPSTLLTSEKSTFNISGIGEYSPSNPNEKYANDKIDMIQAIALSDNIYALKVALLLGSKNIINLLKEFNINNLEALPSIALGSINLSLLELSSIYNSFASLGVYYKPSFIRIVKDSNNNIIYAEKSASKTIASETNTLILNQMLTATFDKTLISYLTPTMINYKTSNTYAAKSGTTSSDSYVLSYNPNYTIGIWVGTDSNNKLSNYTLSKQLYKEIATLLNKEKEPSWYQTNSSTKALYYNPLNHSFSNKGSIYYFKN